LRAIAFAYLCFLVVALLTVRSRIEHTPARFKFSDFASPLTEWCVIKLSLAGFFLFLGIYLPYNFLVLDALANGVSQTSANHLLVIINATGFALLVVLEEP
jgi:RsiW-degrading membrane proteinase PrsW (M82 family)